MRKMHHIFYEKDVWKNHGIRPYAQKQNIVFCFLKKIVFFFFKLNFGLGLAQLNGPGPAEAGQGPKSAGLGPGPAS